mgnify:CR=1 FL=1
MEARGSRFGTLGSAQVRRGGRNQIPDFSGTDMTFYVKDKALDGGGFTDTLSSTWKKVKRFENFGRQGRGHKTLETFPMM